MLNFTVDGNSTVIKASGTHRDMLTEALALEAQLQRFVYRLGPAEYLTFLLEMDEFTKSDGFFDFLQCKPDEETRITMPNLNREGGTDGE